jgi:hypothetical protein
MNEIDYKKVLEDTKTWLKSKPNAGIEGKSIPIIAEDVLDKIAELEQPPRLISEEKKQKIMWPECYGCYQQCQIDKRYSNPCTRTHLSRRERILRYLQALADKVNEGWKPDWEDDEETRFCFFGELSKIGIDSRCEVDYNIAYFKSREAVNRVLAEARPELEELFNIERIHNG